MKNKQLDLRDALDAAARAAVRQADDQAAAAGKVLTAADKYTLYKDELVRLRKQFPRLAGDIDRMIARMGAVPRSLEIEVELKGGAAVVSNLGAVNTLMDTLSGKKATVTVNQDTRTLLPGGTLDLPPGKADGGWIVGSGGPRDDRVHIRASAGEFVVNAASARRHGSLLEAINGRRFADGGWVPGRPDSGSQTRIGDTKIDRSVHLHGPLEVRDFDAFRRQAEMQQRLAALGG
jgi:hypothetical protein